MRCKQCRDRGFYFTRGSVKAGISVTCGCKQSIKIDDIIPTTCENMMLKLIAGGKDLECPGCWQCSPQPEQTVKS